MDGIDREMDKRIVALITEYGNRICFRSCDIDRTDNRRFIHGLGNVPALGCFIRGKWYKTLVGLRSEGPAARPCDLVPWPASPPSSAARSAAGAPDDISLLADPARAHADLLASR